MDKKQMFLQSKAFHINPTDAPGCYAYVQDTRAGYEGYVTLHGTFHCFIRRFGDNGVYLISTLCGVVVHAYVGYDRMHFI